MNPTLAATRATTIAADFLSRTLQPYHPHCRYLHDAVFRETDAGGITEGRFAIGDSCYIDDTGHFNAVEFNICYNQIAYVHLGHAVRHGLISALSGYDEAGFHRKQLSHFLIAGLSSRFKRPLNAAKFYGTFQLTKCTQKSVCTFLETECRFYDDHDGFCRGQITLAVLHP